MNILVQLKTNNNDILYDESSFILTLRIVNQIHTKVYQDSTILVSRRVNFNSVTTRKVVLNKKGGGRKG